MESVYLIAPKPIGTISPDIYGDSGFQGVWRMEEQEGAHELVQAALG